MQQNGFVPQSTDWYTGGQQPEALPYAQPQVPAYQDAYGQPYAQPYAQPQAQPYAQPQAQTYAQPYQQTYAPQPQPAYAPQQAYAPQPQPAYAPQQAPQAPAQQAAPVTPVAHVAPTGQVGGAQAQQSPQQAFAKQLVAVAKSLEQALPSYQILLSVFLDLSVSDKGRSVDGVDAMVTSLREATCHHYATLGAIRRFLCGEATAEVLSSLSVGLHHLQRIQTQVKALHEQVSASASPELRQAINGLSQIITATDTLLTQTAGTVKGLVGPQIWEAAKVYAASGTALAEA